MNPFRQEVERLVDQARLLHARERDISLESVELVGELLRSNASGYLWLSSEGLARRIGLTSNQFWKRAQAARVLERFPAFREQVANGETSITTLTLIAPRLTEANAPIYLDGIRGKTGSEVRELVGKLDIARRSLHTISRQEIDAMVDRALKAAHSRGRPLSRDALLKEALNLWLDEWAEPPSLKKET